MSRSNRSFSFLEAQSTTIGADGYIQRTGNPKVLKVRHSTYLAAEDIGGGKTQIRFAYTNDSKPPSFAAGHTSIQQAPKEKVSIAVYDANTIFDIYTPGNPKSRQVFHGGSVVHVNEWGVVDFVGGEEAEVPPTSTVPPSVQPASSTLLSSVSQKHHAFVESEDEDGSLQVADPSQEGSKQ